MKRKLEFTNHQNDDSKKSEEKKNSTKKTRIKKEAREGYRLTTVKCYFPKICRDPMVKKVVDDIVYRISIISFEVCKLINLYLIWKLDKLAEDVQPMHRICQTFIDNAFALVSTCKTKEKEREYKDDNLKENLQALRKCYNELYLPCRRDNGKEIERISRDDLIAFRQAARVQIQTMSMMHVVRNFKSRTVVWIKAKILESFPLIKNTKKTKKSKKRKVVKNVNSKNSSDVKNNNGKDAKDYKLYEDKNTESDKDSKISKIIGITKTQLLKLSNYVYICTFGHKDSIKEMNEKLETLKKKNEEKFEKFYHSERLMSKMDELIEQSIEIKDDYEIPAATEYNMKTYWHLFLPWLHMVLQDFEEWHNSGSNNNEKIDKSSNNDKTSRETKEVKELKDITQDKEKPNAKQSNNKPKSVMKGIRLFTLFPEHKMRPLHIQIDNTGVKKLKNIVNRELKTKSKSSDIKSNSNKLKVGKNDWDSVFDLSEFPKSGKASFFNSMKTDGYSTSIIMEKKITDKQTVNPLITSTENDANNVKDAKVNNSNSNTKKRKLDYKIKDENTLTNVTLFPDQRVVAIDPGRRDLFVGIDNNEKIVRCSNREYYSKAGFKRRLKMQADWLNKKLRLRDAILNIPTSKTSSLEKYSVHLRYIFPHMFNIFKFYCEQKQKRLRFTTYSFQQRAIDKICRRITGGDKNTIVAVGAGQFSSTFGHLESTPNKALIKRLHMHCNNIVLVDEYLTSQICSTCHLRCLVGPKHKVRKKRKRKALRYKGKNKFKDKVIKNDGKNNEDVKELKDIKEAKDIKNEELLQEGDIDIKKRPIYGVRFCQKCRKLWNRDVNAARNIMSVFLCQLSDAIEKYKTTFNEVRYEGKSENKDEAKNKSNTKYIKIIQSFNNPGIFSLVFSSFIDLCSSLLSSAPKTKPAHLTLSLNRQLRPAPLARSKGYQSSLGP